MASARLSFSRSAPRAASSVPEARVHFSLRYDLLSSILKPARAMTCAIRLREENNPMAHIKLPENVPGIRGPMLISPETTKPLRDFVEVLLRGPNSLAPAEREMIATYVSSQNDCYYCQHSHGAVAAYRLGGDEKLIDDVKANFQSAPVSDKLKAL